IGLKGALLSNSSHDTDKGKVRHDNMATFRSLYSEGLTIRRTGSAALDMANVAAGRLDGFWVRSIACWDVAAGLLIASEAGASIVPCRHLRDTIDVPPPTHVSLDRPAFVAGANQKIANGLHDLLVG
ncbi:MAG: hypothetical protein HOB45_02260, partial [Planctomycetaceae bacterium]|nr:hypothetical protein [Planctomycetaceae bacterium]